MDNENGRKIEYFSKWEREKAIKVASSFYESIKQASVAPPERPARIKELIQYAALGIETPLIINWICPAGTPLEYDQETEKLYRKYPQIDPAEGFLKDYRICS